MRVNLTGLLLWATLTLQVPALNAQTDRTDFLIPDVFSSLGEPLQARLSLGVFDSPTDQPRAQLGSSDLFSEYGISRYQMFAALRLSLSQGLSGELVLTIASDQPIYEPSLRFVVEVRDGVRSQLIPIELLVPTANALGGGRRMLLTRPNDTLWRIANRTRQGVVTNSQQMLAVQRLNPSSFRGNNINGLRPWSMLTLPDAFDAQQMTPREALAQVQQQNLRWQRGGTEAAADNSQAGAGEVRITAVEPSQSTADFSLAGAANGAEVGAATGADTMAGAGAADDFFAPIEDLEDFDVTAADRVNAAALSDDRAEDFSSMLDQAGKASSDPSSALTSKPLPTQSQATTEPQASDSGDSFDLEQLEAQIREEEAGVFSRLFTGLLAPGMVGFLAALVLVVLIIVLMLRRRAARQEQELDEVLGAPDEPTVSAYVDTAADSDDPDEQAQDPAFEADVDPADDEADDDVYTTRLKLAEAYIEMGDQEGAIDMLEEVIADGTPEQQKVAQQIMVRLEEDDD